MLDADAAGAKPTHHHTASRPGKVDVEVHSVNACGGIVLQAQIDVLADPEAKVPPLTEVPLPQFELLHLQALLDDLLRLLPAHGNMTSDLLVSAHTERANRLATLRKHRL